jgi:MFS family permease
MQNRRNFLAFICNIVQYTVDCVKLLQMFAPSTPINHLVRVSRTLKIHRIAISTTFFMHGLCFASWASRIPTIQQHLNLKASELGGVLFVLPAGFFLSLPFSGWFVARAGSRKVAIIAGILYSLALVCIGWSPTITSLILSLFAFGFCGNLLNISMNTQAVSLEALSGEKLMASFHGIWSLAGFAGAAVGTWMMGRGVSPLSHYILICICFLAANGISAFYLIRKDAKADEKRPLFSIPDKSLLNLGIIAFCSMMAEGAMYDWSGIYFLKVVNTRQALISLGYTTFMIAMAGMRFTADRLSTNFGLKRVLQTSGILAFSGLLLAVLFPLLFPALLGFFLTGLGVSSVVPMVYSAAGKSKTMSPGVALSAVSSLGFLGLLLGPPLVGFIAEATSLRVSFLALSGMAIAVFVLASLNSPTTR